MIKVFYGNKGMGKTKMLVDTANSLVSRKTGDIVFIDDSSQLMYDLKHEIRFINVSEFPIEVDSSAFLGLVCGMISEDYDISAVLVDRLTHIIKEKDDSLEEFFSKLNQISSSFNIDFYISMNGDRNSIPQYLKEYV